MRISYYSQATDMPCTWYTFKFSGLVKVLYSRFVYMGIYTQFQRELLSLCRLPLDKGALATSINREESTANTAHGVGCRTGHGPTLGKMEKCTGMKFPVAFERTPTY